MNAVNLDRNAHHSEGRENHGEVPVAQYYRGEKTNEFHTPGDQWTPAEWDAHIQYMHDFADRLRATGEFVSGDALAMDGVWVRYDGPGKPPVTDGPFAETKDLSPAG